MSTKYTIVDGGSYRVFKDFFEPVENCNLVLDNVDFTADSHGNKKSIHIKLKTEHLIELAKQILKKEDVLRERYSLDEEWDLTVLCKDLPED